MLLDILQPQPDHTYLDLGSGEGRVMRAVSNAGAIAHGVELNPDLARLSAEAGPTSVASLPDLGFLEGDAYDGAYLVLVLEHIVDHEQLFREVARVVKPGGVMALVMNHPVWTAPESTPITDDDGEILWRPGAYFSTGSSVEPAGTKKVVFHHRTMADLVNSASAAGWSLEQMVEAPHHEFEDQIGIPRLLAVRWRLPG